LFRNTLLPDIIFDTCDDDCLRTVDTMWRLVIGFGILPAVLAFKFRLAILESPRYTAEVLKESVKAAAQLRATELVNITRTGSASVVSSCGQSGEGHSPSEREVGNRKEGNDRTIPLSPHASSHGHVDDITSLPVDPTHETRTRPTAGASIVGESSTSKKIWKDIKRCYWELGHRQTLMATCLCWFLVDLPFCGLGMNNPHIVGAIWSGDSPPGNHVYSFLLNNESESLVVVSLGAITDGLITIFSVNIIGERRIQMIGFFFSIYPLRGHGERIRNSPENRSIICDSHPIFAVPNFLQLW
jgi:MFS transporter, PHS family, inorganic phosphate transporter